MDTEIKDQINKPWLKENGEVLSERELKYISKFWDQETWDRYLKSLEFEEDHEVIEGCGIPRTEEKVYPTLADLLPTHMDLDDKVMEQVRSALTSRQLSVREQKILYLTYWEKTPERELAALFDVSRSVARKIKKRALMKIKRILSKKLKTEDQKLGLKRGPKTAIYMKGDENEKSKERP